MQKIPPKRQGYNARRWLCQGIKDNPYPPGSVASKEWLLGFAKAAREAGDAEDAHNEKPENQFGELHE